MVLGLCVVLMFGCSDEEAEGGAESGAEFNPLPSKRFATNALFETDLEILAIQPTPNPDRNAYFGDLHVHTTYSFDAYAFGTLATPSDAYRFAKGEEILHPAGFGMQLREPLDFYAVTDHAAFLGVARQAADTTSAFSKLDVSQPYHDLNTPGNTGQSSFLKRIKGFAGFMPSIVAGVDEGSIDRESVLSITRSAWRDTIEAAELHNQPGRFTTFAAFEYTSSSDDSGNLHRNVIFEGTDRLPAVPFSRFHSQNPEGLWDWMDELRALGVESLAIPHNSNGSNGQMFKMTDWAGDPLDDSYAERRIRNEPLIEITQIKGTSETHPSLSSRDEWADFEIAPFRVATMLESEPKGSYARDALRRGLTLESLGIVNAYDFGFIGSSDTHTGATSDDESNYYAKLGLLDARTSMRGSVPSTLLESVMLRFFAPNMLKDVDGRTYIESASPTYGASGLAAVWAEENTRASIYRAFRRKETFATSGPRIRLRFFAGFDFPDSPAPPAERVARAYADGVPMGGDLARSSKGGPPTFLVWATADPLSAPLQRLQIIKGWEAGGETFEEVYDVACSDGLKVDPATHRCPDNGARVDLSDCSISADLGDAELEVRWADPDFDPAERAFYYVRVLENPTCRWSTWDAVRAGVEPRSDLAETIQERAWSSPIRYRPEGA